MCKRITKTPRTRKREEGRRRRVKGRREGGGRKRRAKVGTEIRTDTKSKWVAPTKSWLFKMIKPTHPLLD